MVNLAKWIGIPFFTLLALLAAGEGAVQAQVNPYFLNNPALNLQQTALNLAATGRANGFQTVAGNYFQGASNAAFLNYATGYSPLSYGLGNYSPLASYYNAAAALYNPYGNAYLGAYAGNPYASLTSTGAGYAGGIAGAPYGGSSSYSPYNYNSDPYAGYLRGSADVLKAQGQFVVDVQQSKQKKEQAEQAKIDTRRKLFDEILYERMHTLSFAERQEKIAALRLRRSQSTASVTEVRSGQALNILLKDLKKLHGRRSHGPQIDLDPKILKQINVVGAGRGNIGLLRNEGQLTWPLGLRDLKPTDLAHAIRITLEKKAFIAVRQAANGEVDTGLLKDLAANIKKLHKLLARNVNELPTNQYLEAKRYLNNLDEAITALASPDVANYFNGTWVAKGKTIQDLVSYMTNQGLDFAPGVSGDEAAYQALYSALAAYDLASHQNQVVGGDKKREGAKE
jgi:hypothetical protein